MNKTEKGMWFNVGIIVISIILTGYIAVEIFVSARVPKFFFGFWELSAFTTFLVTLNIFLPKKQRLTDVAPEEYDRLIKKRTALVWLISAGFWLFIINLPLRFIVLSGTTSIPTWAPPIIALVVLPIGLLIIPRRFWFLDPGKSTRSRLQKRALGNLIMLTTILVYTTVKILVKAYDPEETIRYFGEMLTFAAFVGGILALLPVFLLRIKQSEIRYDERDRLINHKAVLATYVTLWLLIICAINLSWSISTSTGSVPAYVLQIVVGGVGCILVLVYSLAILVQYGWRDKNNE